MPILPDYLATINNRTTIATTRDGLHYASLNAAGIATSIKSINASGGLGILGAAATAQHIAYRNLDGTAQQQSQQQQQQHQQYQPYIMTKHPIPGKSMVNFSLIHLVNDDNSNNNNNNGNNNNKVLIVAPINEQLQSINTNNNNNNHTEENKIGENQSNNETSGNNRVMVTKLKDRNSATDSYLASENGSIGILLAMKALVQLIFNPIVGNMSTKYGYRLPIVMGTFCLLVSSLGKLL